MSKTGKWALSAAVMLGVVGVLASIPVEVATVRLPREKNRLFAALKTTIGGDIRLHYLHSVEKTAVEGRFTVGAGPALRVVETRMQSVGTGLPNTGSTDTRREGPWIVVDEGLEEIPGFDFFLSPINETRVSVDNTPFRLEALRPGSVIRLDIEEARLGQWLLWRYVHIDWGKDGP